MYVGTILIWILAMCLILLAIILAVRSFRTCGGMPVAQDHLDESFKKCGFIATLPIICSSPYKEIIMENLTMKSDKPSTKAVLTQILSDGSCDKVLDPITTYPLLMIPCKDIFSEWVDPHHPDVFNYPKFIKWIFNIRESDNLDFYPKPESPLSTYSIRTLKGTLLYERGYINRLSERSGYSVIQLMNFGRQIFTVDQLSLLFELLNIGVGPYDTSVDPLQLKLRGLNVLMRNFKPTEPDVDIENDPRYQRLVKERDNVQEQIGHLKKPPAPPVIKFMMVNIIRHVIVYRYHNGEWLLNDDSTSTKRGSDLLEHRGTKCLNRITLHREIFRGGVVFGVTIFVEDSQIDPLLAHIERFRILPTDAPVIYSSDESICGEAIDAGEDRLKAFLYKQFFIRGTPEIKDQLIRANYMSLLKHFRQDFINWVREGAIRPPSLVGLFVLPKLREFLISNGAPKHTVTDASEIDLIYMYLHPESEERDVHIMYFEPRGDDTFVKKEKIIRFNLKNMDPGVEELKQDLHEIDKSYPQGIRTIDDRRFPRDLINDNGYLKRKLRRPSRTIELSPELPGVKVKLESESEEYSVHIAYYEPRGDDTFEEKKKTIVVNPEDMKPSVDELRQVLLDIDKSYKPQGILSINDIGGDIKSKISSDEYLEIRLSRPGTWLVVSPKPPGVILNVLQ